MRHEYTPDFIARFWAKVNKTDGCWFWTDKPDNGYGRISAGNHAFRLGAHQVAYELASGQLIEERFTCHTCDVKLCVRNDAPGFHEIDGVLIPTWGHLFAGTPLDNMRDMVAKGRALTGDANPARVHPERLARGERHGSRTQPEALPRGDAHPSRIRPDYLPRGEANGNAHLTSLEVAAIRKLAACGSSQRDLARAYGVGKSTIGRILSGANWKHLP